MTLFESELLLICASLAAISFPSFPAPLVGLQGLPATLKFLKFRVLRPSRLDSLLCALHGAIFILSLRLL